MSFASGPAASPVALLDAFVAFLNAAGWTQDAYIADGSGKRYHAHKGTKYIHLRSYINEGQAQLGTSFIVNKSGIAVAGSTGYSGTIPAWYAQAGVPVGFGLGTDTALTGVMSLPAGAITNAWMFADATGDCCVLVALNSFGVYTYIYFGDIVKVQAWTGGMYFGASRPRTAAYGGNDTIESGPPGEYGLLRANVDSFVNLWVNTDQTVDTGKKMLSTTRNINQNEDFLGQHIGYGSLRKRSRSVATDGLLLLPTLWSVERDFAGARSGGGFSMAGRIPDVFQTTSTFVAPGSTFSIGSDDYVVFPQFAVRKYP